MTEIQARRTVRKIVPFNFKTFPANFYRLSLPNREVKRDVVVTRRDETGHAIRKWRLLTVIALQYTGPPLPQKGCEVVIEERVLSCERFQVE